MTAALHLTEEIHLPTPRDQWLAVIRIGKMSHSRTAIFLRERASPICLGNFVGWVSEDDADTEQRWAPGAGTVAGMVRRRRRIRRFSSLADCVADGLLGCQLFFKLAPVSAGTGPPRGAPLSWGVRRRCTGDRRQVLEWGGSRTRKPQSLSDKPIRSAQEISSQARLWEVPAVREDNLLQEKTRQERRDIFAWSIDVWDQCSGRLDFLSAVAHRSTISIQQHTSAVQLLFLFRVIATSK